MSNPDLLVPPETRPAPAKRGGWLVRGWEGLTVVEVLHERCAGLDISKKDVKVCVRVPGGRGGRYRSEVTTFGSMTGQILELRAYLIEQQVTLVLMESTGDYWKPFYYLLEGAPFELMLVNPRQARGMPGRKTDVSDSQWLADLGAHGLVRASLVPAPPIRELRDLTRTHADLTRDRTREYNRLESVLEDAGIKLTSVASKITGVSCRLMLEALVTGERNPEVLANLAKASLRDKRDQLTLAMTGRFTEHHTFLVALHLQVIDQQTTAIEQVTAKVKVVTEPFRAQLTLLETIPGVSTEIAGVIIAETGGDMTKFPTAGHLASWAGVCPGHNQSAEVTKKAKTRPGNSYLKGALGQAAMSSMQVHDTFLQDRYQRLRPRIKGLRTIVALEHSILRSVWYMLSNNEPYRELGAGYHQKRHPQNAMRSITRQANRLGYTVKFEHIPQTV